MIYFEGDPDVMASEPDEPRSKYRCSRKTLVNAVKSLVPFCDWITRYRWYDFVAGDLPAGFLLAVLHVPQGLAYGMLANVEPVVGVYTGVVPVLVYIFFASSRHASLGTFAVVCLMTGETVAQHTSFNPRVVATATCFFVAVVQLVAWALRLGAAARLLSETLVSAVTVGAGVHVFTSQLRVILSAQLPQKLYFGPLGLVYLYRDLFTNIATANVASVVTGVITIALLLAYHLLLFPRIKIYKATYFVPIELLIMAAAIVIAWCVDLPEMSTVGDVPVGLPAPRNPVESWYLLVGVMAHGAAIAIVSYTVSYSLSVMLASPETPLGANQELLAHGLANMVGAVFGCVPASASLSRSILHKATGGRTQVAGLVSSSILMLLLLSAGPAFRPLPKSILSAIIIVALRGLFTKAIIMLPKTFRLNCLDGGVWCLTFLVVVLVDTLWGLLCGVFLTLVYVFQQSSAVHVDVVGRLELTRPGYVSLASHPDAVEIPGIRILRIYCNLNFCNVLSVKANVEKMSGIDLAAVSKVVSELKKAKISEEVDRLVAARNDLLTVKWKASTSKEETSELKCIILDLNMVKTCDMTSVNTFNIMKQAYSNVDILFIPISENLISLTPVSHIGEAIKIWEDRTARSQS